MARGRPRKLSPEQVQHAALDRRNGMSWRDLSKKYKCAVNTLRTALFEYSDEFEPLLLIERASLETQVSAAHTEIENIKKALKKRFNLHI